nr:MAG: hypothetical protein [Picornavirales sp.]
MNLNNNKTNTYFNNNCSNNNVLYSNMNNEQKQQQGTSDSSNSEPKQQQQGTSDSSNSEPKQQQQGFSDPLISEQKQQQQGPSNSSILDTTRQQQQTKSTLGSIKFLNTTKKSLPTCVADTQLATDIENLNITIATTEGTKMHYEKHLTASTKQPGHVKARTYVLEDTSIPKWETIMGEYEVTQLATEQAPDKTVEEHFSTILAQLPIFTGTKLDKMVQVTNVTSNLMSLMNSFWIMHKCKNLPKSVKIINGLSMASNVTALATSIWQIVDKVKGQKFDKIKQGIPLLVKSLTKEIETIPEHIEMNNFSNTAKSNFDFSGWNIVKVLTTLGAILMAILTKCDLVSAKAFISGSHLLKATTTYKKEGLEFIKMIATEILGIDTVGDRTYINKLKELALEADDLATAPIFEYASNPAKCARLQSLTKDIIHYSDKCYDTVGNSNIAKTYLQQLVTSRIRLNEKMNTVKEMLTNKDRQTTVGMMLCGDQGVGKSEAIKYIAQQMGNILGYNSNVYNVRKSGEFFRVYAGEAFGEFNEFANTPAADPTIIELNSIISSDDVNFAGASIELKHQPCKLKCVILTANEVTPNLVATLKHTSIRAFYDRVERFIIVDPKEPQRGDEAAWRKPDFSHLTVNHVVGTFATASDITTNKISFKQMVMYMVSRVAAEELRFLEKGIKNNIFPVDDAIKRRIDYLTPLITHYAKSNSSGGEYFVTRIQGEPGTNKTTMAKQILPQIAKKHSIPFHQINDIKDLKYTEKAVYLLDDCLNSDDDLSAYFRWTNKVSNESLLYINTNLIPYEKKRTIQQRITGCFSKTGQNDYYCRLKGEVYLTYPGLARRIGISGLVKARPKGEILLNDPKRTLHGIKTSTDFYCNGTRYSEQQFEKFLEESYDKFVRVKTGPIYQNSKCPQDAKFDIRIVAKNYEELREVFNSKIGIASVIAGTSSKVAVDVTPQIRDEFASLFANFSTLVPKKIDDITEDQLKDLVVNYMKLFSSRKRDLSMSVHINALLSMKLYQGIIYDEEVIDAEVQISNDNKGINFIAYGITEHFTWKDVVRITKRGATQAETDRLGIQNLNKLHLYIINNSPLFPRYKIHSLYDDFETQISSLIDTKQVLKLMKNPIVISIGVIATLAATAGFIYKIAKMHDSEIKANAASGYIDSDEPGGDEELNKKLQPYVEGYARNIFDSAKRAEFRQQAHDAGLADHFNKWEAEWRSNSKTFSQISAFEKDAFDRALADLMRNGDMEEICNLTKKSSFLTSESMKRIMHQEANSNMVATEAIIPNMKPNVKDVVTEIARTHNVRVSFPSVNGTNYGLILKGNLIITVAHGIDTLGDIVFVNESGRQYNAEVLNFSRQRDIAIIRVTDKHWVSKKDITRHFANADDFANMNHGWFIRAFENETSMFPAPIKFIPTGAEINDPNNERYRLSADYFKYKVSYVTTLEGIFKEGDCGLPLVNISANGFKFIGIHNGYTSRDKGIGFFSSLNKEFLLAGLDFKSNMVTDIEVKPSLQLTDSIDGNSRQVIPQFYVDAFALKRASLLSPKHTGTEELPVIGYFPNLHVRSNPKNVKSYKSICPKIDFEKTKLPSAIDTRDVTDFSKLIKDGKGEYNTLASQAMLFGRKNKVGEIDPEIFQATSRFLKMKMKSILGDNQNKLRIGEAINGYEALQPLDMTTSTGLYLKACHKIPVKRPPGNENILFTQDVNGRYSINRTTVPGKDLFDMILSGSDYIEQGIPLAVFAKDNPKVELLPIDKVKEGKVRLFSELDLYINIILRQFFGRQMSILFKKHLETSYAMGANPYADFTFYYQRLKNFKGKLFDTDYSRLDKTIPPELIDEFVHCLCQNFPEDTRKALSYTLCNMFHVIEGSIYRTTRGNASGSFVTTLLNCYVLEFVDVYTVIARYKELYGRIPSYKEILELLLTIILGDDKISKYSELLKMSFQILETNALKFGLVLTKAKVEYKDAISFCSRLFLYDEKENIVFPALKKESVVTHLYYGRGPTNNDDMARINVALFEASLWDEEFFNRVNGICMVKARHEGYFDQCNWFTYKEYRDNFIQYVRLYADSPLLQVRGDLEPNLENKSNNTFEGLLFSKFINTEKTTPNFDMASYVTKLFEYCQKHDIKVLTETRPYGGKWSATFSLKVGNTDIVSTGLGLNLREAKRQAALQTLEKLGVVAKSNSLPHLVRTEQAALQHTQLDITTEDDEYHNIINSLVARNIITDVTYTYRTDACSWTSKVTIASVETKTEEVNFEILANSVLGKANMGPDNVPIEPMTINSASQYQGVGRLPDGNTNAQPVAMAPEMGPPGENINATNELLMCKTLNPLGAPNMLPVGAIGFDAKDLIYTTFLDRDTEIEITNDAPSGTVLFQIPYGVDTPYTNSYIKTYAAMHERYAGALKYRLTTIGNQLYSGSIGVAWYPRRVTTTTINISEMQKYSWYAKGVQMPWTEDITLHDARQDLFWRKVADDTGNLDDRPHLVCFLFVSVKNPYDAPSTVRMRIASKLNGSTEANPFQFANPELPVGITTTSSDSASSGTTPLLEVYKHFRNFPVQIYTDGTLANKFEVDYIQAPYYTNSLTDVAIGGQTGGQISSANLRYQGMSNELVGVGRPALISNWPSLNDKVPGITATTPWLIGVKFITTMSKENFGQYAYSCPFVSDAGSDLDETGFNMAKTLSNWALSSKLKYLQLHWSNLTFQTGVEPVAGLPDSYCYVIGTNKVITDKGTTIAVFYLAGFTSVNPCVINDNNYIGPTPHNYSNLQFTIDYDRIETASSAPSGTSSVLPLGWNKIAISTILPSVVLTANPTAFTATDDITLLQDFSQYDDLPLSQTVQFALIDVRSNTIIATVRYMQEYRIFVISKKFPADSNFKALPVEGRYLAFARLAVISRGLEFPVTDTSLWIDRESLTTMQLNGLADGEPQEYEMIRVLKNVELAKSNAWLAAASIGGGVMQGVGQGLNSMADRKFQAKMQNNQFEFLEGMQGKKFDFEELMQSGRFEQERDMAAIHASNQMSIDTNRARQHQIARGMEGRVLSMPGSSYA